MGSAANLRVPCKAMVRDASNAAANNEGFIAPNGSAVAYAGEGGIAVALAPPRIEYRTVEIVKEEQKAKRESKRCYIVIRVVAIIIFCTVVAGTVRFRHSISEY